MSQTDPKSPQTKANASAGKSSPAPSPQKAGNKPGGMKGLWYLVVLLLAAAVLVAYWVRKGGEEPRPVVSAAEEEGFVVAPEADAEAEGDSLTAALVIDSSVRGADVYLNGNRVGKTPHKATPLPPGDYEVRVVQDGYETFEGQVRVETADDSIHADLRPLRGASEPREEVAAPDGEEPAAAPANIRRSGGTVAVKHNHRIGSCEGVLRSSTDGVHYDSDHKDAFFAAYADIEELSLDGAELTLKVRDGRKYDFNEPNDDPESLAAFYERVDQAVPEAESAN